MAEGELQLDSESKFKARAGEIARRWMNAGLAPLLIGLQGDLGSGKTTWVRGMLEGLGHAGRVPSPTYTLVETYALEKITLVHVDLYRLSTSDDTDSQAEIESLGLRDWLEQSSTWLLVEWPDRSPLLASRCDLRVAFEAGAGEQRTLRFSALSRLGETALKELALYSKSASS